MPPGGGQILIAFIPLAIALLLSGLSQWFVRRMAIRHCELGKAVVPTVLWPFVHTYARRASPEFQREYKPFIRKVVVVVWALSGLSIVLMIRAAY